MADLGDVGLGTLATTQSVARSGLTLAVQPTGNGPISNAAPFVADSRGVVILLGRRGARMDATRANVSGIWSFYDLSQGIYFATQAAASRQWRIDVAADLSFTVTPISSSFPRTYAWASA